MKWIFHLCQSMYMVEEEHPSHASGDGQQIRFAEANPIPDGRFDPALIFPGAEQIDLKNTSLMTQMAAEQWQLQWKRESEAANSIRPLTLKIMGIKTTTPADFAKKTLQSIDERVIEKVKELKLTDPSDEDVRAVRSEVLKEFKPKNKEDIRFEYELLRRKNQLDFALEHGQWKQAKKTILSVSKYQENPSRTQQPFIDSFMDFASKRTTDEVDHRTENNELGQVYSLFRGMHGAFEKNKRATQLALVSDETRTKLESEAFLKIPEKNLSRTMEKEGLSLYKEEELILLEAGFEPSTIRSLEKVQEVVFQKFEKQLASAMDPEYDRMQNYRNLRENYQKAGFTDTEFIQSERIQQKVITALNNRLQNTPLSSLSKFKEDMGTIGFTDVVVRYIQLIDTQNLLQKRLQTELSNALSNDSTSVESFAKARSQLDAAGFDTDTFMQSEGVQNIIKKTLRSRLTSRGFTSFQELAISYSKAGFSVDTATMISDNRIRKALKKTLRASLWEGSIAEFTKRSAELTQLGLEQQVIAFRNDPKTRKRMLDIYRDAVSDAFSSRAKDPEKAEELLKTIQESGFFRDQIIKDETILAYISKRMKDDLTNGGLKDFDASSKLAHALGFDEVVNEVRQSSKATVYIQNKLSDRLSYTAKDFAAYVQQARDSGFEEEVRKFAQSKKAMERVHGKLGDKLMYALGSDSQNTQEFTDMSLQYTIAGFDIAKFRTNTNTQNIIKGILSSRLEYGLSKFTVVSKTVDSLGFSDVLKQFQADKKIVEQVHIKLLKELESSLTREKPSIEPFEKFRDQIQQAGFSIDSFTAYGKAKTALISILDDRLRQYEDIARFDQQQKVLQAAGFSQAVQEYKDNPKTKKLIRRLIQSKQRWHSTEAAVLLAQSFRDAGFAV